jgi:hypothetical protein
MGEVVRVIAIMERNISVCTRRGPMKHATLLLGLAIVLASIAAAQASDWQCGRHYIMIADTGLHIPTTLHARGLQPPRKHVAQLLFSRFPKTQARGSVNYWTKQRRRAVNGSHPPAAAPNRTSSRLSSSK